MSSAPARNQPDFMTQPSTLQSFPLEGRKILLRRASAMARFVTEVIQSMPVGEDFDSAQARGFITATPNGRVGASGQRRRRLPQQQRLDEGAGDGVTG